MFPHEFFTADHGTSQHDQSTQSDETICLILSDPLHPGLPGWIHESDMPAGGAEGVRLTSPINTTRLTHIACGSIDIKGQVQILCPVLIEYKEVISLRG